MLGLQGKFLLECVWSRQTFYLLVWPASRPGWLTDNTCVYNTTHTYWTWSWHGHTNDTSMTWTHSWHNTHAHLESMVHNITHTYGPGYTHLWSRVHTPRVAGRQVPATFLQFPGLLQSITQPQTVALFHHWLLWGECLRCVATWHRLGNSGGWGMGDSWEAFRLWVGAWFLQ